MSPITDAAAGSISQRAANSTTKTQGVSASSTRPVVSLAQAPHRIVGNIMKHEAGRHDLLARLLSSHDIPAACDLAGLDEDQRSRILALDACSHRITVYENWLHREEIREAELNGCVMRMLDTVDVELANQLLDQVDPGVQ